MSETQAISHGEKFFRRIAAPLMRAAVVLDVPVERIAEILRSAFVAAVADAIPGAPGDERAAHLLGDMQPDLFSKLIAQRPAVGETAFELPAIAHLIYAWYRRAGYGDAEGQPLRLPIAGKAPSFQVLVEEFCPDEPPEQVLSELISMRTVRETDDGNLELAGFYQYSLKSRESRIDHAAMALACFLDTAVRRSIEGEDSQRLQRFAISRSIANDEAEDILTQISAIVQESHRRVLDVLTDAEKRSRGRATRTVGAGAYTFLDENLKVQTPR